MSRPIEQALLSLIPAHGPELPPSLVELAGSLLAQSRNRASTLKADEEVARHYACANLACERLKIALDLPPIEPRPPIPPRIYKRLYTHLDNILPNPSATPRASRTRNANSELSPATKSRPLPSRGTPSRESALSQFRKPGPQTPTRSSAWRRDALPPSTPGLYPWVQPVARFLCAETGNDEFAPSVLAGIEFVLAQSNEEIWVSNHAADLVAVIFFFVVMRVRAIDSADPTIDRQGYVPLRKEILAQLGRARADVKANHVGEGDFWLGWKTLKSREFDAAVAHVNDRDWLTGDWYKGIADVASARGVDFEIMDQEDHDSGVQIPARRADMMLQDKYDLLSEARRSDYKMWKEKMLSRINQPVKVGS
ncbi:origin recognition complex subunit 6 (ORC6) domain-containing protein [Hirsutella rhossiliensis]|uniref:Origin recognition complex subunit 6 (ORC6) domain-containing protein n=1 Tax=Hirsutella rhossiliensis TaxID=111463 RepID=A0A9P8SLE9_9HYPO|nr:origin recognition complex subunit 6 (ORC6) domain-containing protein [Hirsutella rhossiliensis]KAH0966886.1 origin recognition complex subunit 6 (ORC6) domain-containing protein [Hirsutella rhossiliensis]